MYRAILFTWIGVVFCFICRGQNEGIPIRLHDSLQTDLSSDTFKVKENATRDYIQFYQKYISGIRGHSCPMYPSCSRYGMMAFSEEKFVTAFVMTSDRLLRCGHDHMNYPLTWQSGDFKYVDYPSMSDVPAGVLWSPVKLFYSFSDTLPDDSVLVFAKRLLNQQYYHEALLEFMRLEFGSAVFDVEIFINKIICLKSIGEYEKALFEYAIRCPQEYKSNTELNYQMALIQFKLDNLTEARNHVFIAQQGCGEKFCTSKVLLLEGVLYAQERNWLMAKEAYQRLADMPHLEDIAMTNLKIIEEAQQLNKKSPTLAALMAIIPGLGYVYSGHAQTGLTAFTVNGLMAYATYSSIKSGNYGVAILTGCFNLSFYIGNIVGSSKSAARYNHQKHSEIVSRIKFNSKL
jgi:putative component of membrane protein insertase Oxa1/YidC/SpoIIIJ protein YidD